MNLHRIKYPFAIFTETGSTVHASDVPNGLNCNCHCPFCSEKLIAINNEGNKREDHFRHRADTNCKADYETFIHWLSKHVVKNLKYITLPAIDTSDIRFDSEFLTERNGILKKHGLDPYLLNPRTEKVQPPMKIPITDCKNEVWFKTNLGAVKPDIVIYYEDNEFFIEPFFTNPISDEKHQKLVQLNKSVLAINLGSFVERNGPVFTLEKFITFLQDETRSKKWVVIRKEKIEKLKQTYLVELEKQLLLKSEIITEYKDLEKAIANFYSEIGEHNKQIQKLHENIAVIQNRRKEIEADLGIVNDIYEDLK